MRPASTDAAGSPAEILSLHDQRATDPAVAGAKAANLARAARAGLPVLPGFVIVGASAGPLGIDPAATADLVVSWADLSAHGSRPLVVRSSSANEDGSTSSMAGLFTSVLDVRGWDDFVSAVGRVLDSGTSGRVTTLAGPAAAPMGVLVQPYLQPAKGGVMFGADPVTGARNRVVVAAVRGGPQRLVHGEVAGSSWTMGRGGRVAGHQPGVEGADLTPGERGSLARLARRTRRLYGEPQDVEWAFDDGGKLWLLQSRPITALSRAQRPRGPVLGPGPVAETFPHPLSSLERDLWVEPLREGLAEAVVLAGVATRRRVERSPVVVTVGGRVAADLALLGGQARDHRLLGRLDPRPPLRRLQAAWRVGRLRSALPGLARDLIGEADAQLDAVPDLRTLSSAELFSVLHRSRQALVGLHGHEVLLGLLVPAGAVGVTGASMALRLVAAGRAEGLDDQAIVARHPVALVLVVPAIRPAVELPPVPSTIPAGAGDGDELALLREALRARARWVQELSGRAAWELGRRLSDRSVLPDPSAVRLLSLAELETAVFSAAAPEDLRLRAGRSEGPPLPARFRLTSDGSVVPVRERRARGGAEDTAAGVGAGGGRRAGAVHQGPAAAPAGSVLVVRNLEPDLAAALPVVAGVVAENGSPLSHLAILARELGVPVVVGVEGALDRFSTGTVVLVDGGTGEVRAMEAVDQEEVG